MDGSAASTVSAPSLQSLPRDRVVLLDVARGAIYATKAPAALPSAPAAAVSKRAVRGQPGEMFKQQQQQPASGGEDNQPAELLTPDVTADLPLIRGSSPSPNPEPSSSSGPSRASEQQQDGADSSDAQQQDSSSSNSRKLLFVRSVDERRVVSEQPAGMPLASVGQLLSYGQEWHCSAALIGERTIVTAAHCVYDRSSGSFARGLYFVPGRFRDASGAIRAPYGAYDIAKVYVSSRFVAGEPQDIWDADLAVLQLQDNVQVGKVLGYFGIDVPAVAAAAAAGPASAEAPEIKAPTAAGTQSIEIAAAGRRVLQPGRKQQQRSARLWQGQLSTAGYPSDREEGTLVRTKCQAEQALVSATGSTIKLTGCSTHLGQSGSALFNGKAQVRGVVSFEIVGAGGYNGGSAITHSSYDTLIRPYAV
ncbi:trypsin-like cysteine/serine peptidase domain-containing protein [Scenedesmus sp. NREL 46B-D3]|nr:trypsin-like cysteine/serine peptidase domain-containing protein [Scenedesmus sp. NREL 46B-D3]